MTDDTVAKKIKHTHKNTSNLLLNVLNNEGLYKCVELFNMTIIPIYGLFLMAVWKAKTCTLSEWLFTNFT
jgi:hypothetical protein